MDTQSVKTSTNVPLDTQGIDAGKKIIGRERGIITDTLGLLLAVIVTAAGGPSNAPCAPRGALLYPRCSREGLGGRFLGRMADLDPKGEGDKSMPETRRPGPVVRDGALGGPA
jgi:hypothetical protein